ncbi:retrovirus-related Pol polyprotein from transposon opus [Trichonephila clavipes]|nr:retrovirus-related Pol polyprotein from transposon opus [Trichonephila clavipes]
MPRLQKVFKKRKGKYYPRKNTINSKVSTTDCKLNAQAEHAHDSKQSCAKEKKIPDLNESFSSFGDSVGILNAIMNLNILAFVFKNEVHCKMCNSGLDMQVFKVGNRLTEHEIDNLQSYYGSAIPEKSQQCSEYMASYLGHFFCISYQLMNYPQHGLCPIREKIMFMDLKAEASARDLDESPDPSMSKIVLRNLIISSKYYKEEEAKELLEVITAERLETEQRQKLEQQEQLSIEKLRLEMEISRIANQSANQNNGQTSRVKSLDEIVKMVRLLTVKVPNKSDGWEYFFSSLEKAFASEMVSDELKPKVVLKEYEPSLKICLENFRKAKRNSDETFSQFASRLTSMWLYYCKLREANDFESVNQLIVADKMFEMLDSETATHIGVLQGEEWYKPRDLGKQCDIFYAYKGKSYDEPERAKWNDSEREVLMVVGGQVTEIKKFACFTCGSDKHFKRDCPKNKGVDNKRLNENKVSTEGTELVDGTVAARVDVLGKVIPRRAIEDKLSKLVKTSISVDGKLVHALLDSGTEITVIKKDLVPGSRLKELPRFI